VSLFVLNNNNNNNNVFSVLNIINIFCNIPLVGIGILPAKRVKGQMFMESKYDGERLLTTSAKHELIIRVGATRFKTRGISVTWPQRGI
jgi:hypothetical protein